MVQFADYRHYWCWLYTVHGNTKKEVEIQTQKNKSGHSVLAQVLNSMKLFSLILQCKIKMCIPSQNHNGTSTFFIVDI